MCDSFWNIFWMANIFQNLGWVKWIINLEICRRDQPDQKMIDHVSGLSWNLPFCSWAGGWNKVSWWVFVWEGYGNQIFDMLTSRYQPVYMAVCIGLATFIFSQLVNLHWWDSGKNASFFQMFGALIIIMFFFCIFWQIRWLGAQNQRMRGYCPSICLQQVLPVQVCEGSGPWEMLQLFS